MSKITITEALAEIKTIEKRVQTKEDFVLRYLTRQEQYKDPHVNDGGSPSVIARERQAINDLEVRKLAIRQAIQRANQSTEITGGNQSHTIAEWLIWRREVAPTIQSFLNHMVNLINSIREEAKRKGLATVSSGDVATNPTDIVVNVDEFALAKEIEEMENIMGTLDGLLSLKNATTFIEI